MKSLKIGDIVYNADGEKAIVLAIDEGYCWVKFENGGYYTWPIDAPRRTPPFSLNLI